MMKMTKRILSALMAVVMSASILTISAFATGTPSVTLTPSATTVAPGGTFTIDVAIANNPGIVYLELDMERSLKVEDGLEITNVEDTGLISGNMFDGAEYWNYDEWWYFIWQNPTIKSDITENGTVARVTYKVADTVAPGTEMKFDITTITDSGATKNYAKQAVDFGSATATVTVASAEKPAPVAALEQLSTSPNAENKYTQGFLATGTATADTKAIKGVTFALTRVEDNATDSISHTFGTEITAGTVKVAVNIVNVDADATITCVPSFN